MSSSLMNAILAVFYTVISLFAISDLKRFIFHVHISRVDRVPVEINVDSSSSSLSLWYAISIGIIFNIFILIFSTINFCILSWRRVYVNHLYFSTLILSCLLTVRFIINIIITKRRNGLSTPTLVERSFFAPSLSLEEELTTLTLDWSIKMIAIIFTIIVGCGQKQKQLLNVERQSEDKLMSNFE